MNPPRPTHDQIAQRAQSIWRDWDYPQGRDDEIWLAAERQLSAAGTGTTCDPAPRGSEAPAALVDRIQAETAAESAVEYLISPAIPEAEAVKAALQNKPPDG